MLDNQIGRLNTRLGHQQDKNNIQYKTRHFLKEHLYPKYKAHQNYHKEKLNLNAYIPLIV